VAHAKPSAPAKGSAKEAAKTTQGYALVLGLDDGSITKSLAKKYTVIAIDSDAAKVNALRKHFHKRGSYGSRITILVGKPLDYSFPPFLATFVTGTAPNANNIVEALPKIFHTLRPYGGTASVSVLPKDLNEIKNAVAEIKTAQFGSLETAQGRTLILSRPGPLPEAADWSHAGGGAGNTGSSDDRFLRGPLGLLWYDGSIRWQRQPGKTEVRVAGGRILILSKRDHPPRLYELPLLPGRSGIQIARYVTSIPPLPQPSFGDILANPVLGKLGDVPTAMDISPDGSRAVVMTYRAILSFRRLPGMGWREAFSRPPRKLADHALLQGEALAFDARGERIYYTTERRPASLWVLSPSDESSLEQPAGGSGGDDE